MSTQRCHYCEKGEIMAAIAIEVCQLSVSTVYLFREQSHPGRVIVAYNEHVGDVVELPADKQAAFFADVVKTSKALYAAFKPDKINYGAFGDTMRHLHFHLVPKYRDGFEWGGVFAMNPQKVTLTEPEYAEMVKKIRQALA